MKARDVLLEVMQEQPDEEATADPAAAIDCSRQLRSQVLKQLDTQTVLRVLSILCDESVCKAQRATLITNTNILEIQRLI